MNYTTHATLSPIEKIFKDADKEIAGAMPTGASAGLFGSFGILSGPPIIFGLAPFRSLVCESAVCQSPVVLLAKFFDWDTKIYDYFTGNADSVTKQEKEKLLQEALKKQNAALKVLKEKEKISSEKIQELLRIEKELLNIISKLEKDLGTA